MANIDNCKGAYEKFKVFGDNAATAMSGKNFAKCCIDAGVVAKPGDKKKPKTKKIIMVDVDNACKKVRPQGRLTYDDFKKALLLLEEREKGIIDLIANANPASNAKTVMSKTGGVEKMTDASQYTGSHKERFDKDGKGKGIDGRAERVENSGYVGNYKGANTYDSK